MLFSTGRTVSDLGDHAEHGAAGQHHARSPAPALMPILWMKSAPSTPPSIPSMPAVKLNTRDAENITLYVMPISA